MQVKKQKWCSTVVYVTLTSFLFFGQKAFPQGPRLPHSPDNHMQQPSLKKATPDEIADKETRWMKKKLKLKKDQLQSVKAINAVYAFKRKDYQAAMEPGDKGNNQKIMDKLALLDKEKDGELRKVFTEKQYNLYIKKKPELLEKTSGNNSAGRLPPPPGDSF